MATVASVQSQIDATTLAQAMTTFTSIAASVQAGAASLPSGALATAEDIAGLIDPSLIPLFGALQAVMPLLGDALSLLEGGTAAPGNYWLGAPRAI